MLAPRRHAFRPWQYFAVLVAMALASFFEAEFVFVRQDMLDLPYLVVAAISAIYGDYFAGILAIVCGTVSIAIIGETGFNHHLHNSSRVIAYLAASLIIFILARRSRELMLNNLSLSESVTQMEKVSNKLKNQVKVNKKDLKRLNSINEELRSVVDNIMDDEDLWAGGVKKGVQSRIKKT